MIFNLVVLLAICVALANAGLVRFPMKKHSNADFVRNIRERAAKGMRSGPVAGTTPGTIVITNYANSQVLKAPFFLFFNFFIKSINKSQSFY